VLVAPCSTSTLVAADTALLRPLGERPVLEFIAFIPS
jgi:hypothetical protein